MQKSAGNNCTLQTDTFIMFYKL
uniref:Uncharacterized protein n=1 Tax=Anguilla anguilla TaxID=7936 RepID=A0A0E9TKE0_ANGAN